MKTKELIEIANKCCNGICLGAGYECPYFDIMDCQRDLIKRLADRLEKEIRSEAIRDFADRFDDVLVAMRDEYAHFGRPEYGLVCEVVHHKLLKTVREMVGAENET